MPQNQHPIIESASTPSFISKDVKDGDYFFLNLNPSPTSELVVIAGGSEVCNANYCVERKEFDYYAIEYVAHGHCRVNLHDKRYDLKPGAVFCYGPNTPHKIENTGDQELVKFFVDLQGTKVTELLWDTFLNLTRSQNIGGYTIYSVSYKIVARREAKIHSGSDVS